MYKFAPGCKSRESGQGGGLGERCWGLWGEGRCYATYSEPVPRNRTKTEASDFTLLEGLHRCVAIRCWQVNCVLSGQLNLCQ